VHSSVSLVLASSIMSYKPEDPLLAPKSPPAFHYQNSNPAPTQAPTYTTLPNGQVQMIYTMPSGFVPPSYQYPTHDQHVYNQLPPQAYVQYPSPMPPAYVYSKPSSGGDGLYVGALVTFIVGLFTFVPHLVSLILTFVMVNKGYLHGGRKAAVMVMAVLELIVWLFCASFSWYFTNDCDDDYYDNYCYSMYWGWIAIVIWWVVALSCGIPRVVFLKHHQPPYQPHM